MVERRGLKKTDKEARRVDKMVQPDRSFAQAVTVPILQIERNPMADRLEEILGKQKDTMQDALEKVMASCVKDKMGSCIFSVVSWYLSCSRESHT
ncbi:hypothetical protein SLA2020_360120 [Shorea laevis]